MKKYFLLILFSPVVTFVQGVAQTNTFPSTGNAGIGTTSPSAKLDVNFFDNSGVNPQYGLLLQTASFYTGTNAVNSYYLKTLDQGNGQVSFIVRGDGYVDIGTSTPQARLSVNGDVYAKKVKVTQSGWPDYVFHPAYRLRPLSEVEQFIQLHKHLPEVPSVSQVEKDGIDLGDNQSTLLKKIEELTLYLIAQNKRLEALEKQLQQLKKGK